MVLVGSRPLPVSGRFVALFGSHAAALKEFWDFENLDLGI